MTGHLRIDRYKTVCDFTRTTEGASHTNVTHVAMATLLGVGLMCPTIALARMPPDIAEKIAAMGGVVELENTGKIYAPLHEKEPYAGIKVVRDVEVRDTSPPSR